MKFFRKVLAAREDLLWGKTQVTQLRGNSSVSVTPFNLVHGVANITELKALDTTKYFFAISYDGTNMCVYAFDINEVTAADDITYFQPNTGSGRWVKRTL